MKMVIMGYPGAGKTWTTEYLSKTYGLPTMQLDAVAFDKNWKRLNDTDILPKVAAFIELDRWIIDGYYSDILFEERMQAADEIVLLLLPRLTCLRRAIKRTRERKAAGYENDMNLWFLKFLLVESRSAKRKKVYQDIVRRYSGKVTVLKSERQVERFLQELEKRRELS